MSSGSMRLHELFLQCALKYKNCFYISLRCRSSYFKHTSYINMQRVCNDNVDFQRYNCGMEDFKTPTTLSSQKVRQPIRSKNFYRNHFSRLRKLTEQNSISPFPLESTSNMIWGSFWYEIYRMDMVCYGVFKTHLSGIYFHLRRELESEQFFLRIHQ